MQIAETAHSEWKQGWPVILASGAGMSLPSLVMFSMGLFVAPLENEFGWSRTVITSGMTVMAVVGFFFGPVIGLLVDRFGPRRIAVPGVFLYCSMFAALAMTPDSKLYWWTLWAALAFAALLVKPTVWTTAIASRFDKMRGLALALTLSGSSFTAILTPVVAGYIIGNFGWRSGYAGVAFLWFLFAMPLILLSFYGAADLDRARPQQHAKVPPSGVGLKEAVTSPVFMKLALASFMVILTVSSSLVHFVPMVMDGGLDRASAVGLASAIGGAALCGRLVTGSLLDRLDARIVGAVAFMIPGLGCIVMLFYDGGIAMAVLLAVLFGISSGAELEVISYLSSRFFGMRNFATLFSLIVAMLSLAGGFGVPLASLTHDHFGSYDLALYCGIPLTFGASFLLLTLGRYPPQAQQ